MKYIELNLVAGKPINIWIHALSHMWPRQEQGTVIMTLDGSTSWVEESMDQIREKVLFA